MYNNRKKLAEQYGSQPARAVWIEIYGDVINAIELLSQPARAVWIEITLIVWTYGAVLRHSLRGLCGLKSQISVQTTNEDTVTACEGCVD